MSLFKEFDLYKGIIAVSVLLVPAAAYFVYWVDKEIQTAEVAVTQAIRADGEIEQIGQLLQKLKKMEENRSMSAGGENHRLYFERRILNSGVALAADFQISNEQARPVPGQRNARDKETTIAFKRDRRDYPLSRTLLGAIVFNCEAQSRVWKLRALSATNAELVEFYRGKKEPPKTVADDWTVRSMIFARREPQR